MNNFQAGWYVIYTKPRHEKKVHGGLMEKNMNSFLPTRKTLKVWHDRKKCIQEPLFPSYVFVYLNNIQDYYDGMAEEGGICYVRFGKQIARVNEAIIDDLRLVASRDVEIEESSNWIQPGRRLVVCEGPLSGLSCELVQFNEKQKLLVRIELLRRNLLISLPVENFLNQE